MRMKIFQAPTAAEAMRLVRQSLGDEAVILSTKQDGIAGFAITAAVESDIADDAITRTIATSAPLNAGAENPELAPGSAPGSAPGLELTPQGEALIRALAYHGVPTALAERIYRKADDIGLDDLPAALSGAIDANFRFAPLGPAPQRPCMLIGPVGVGKTVTVAKIATRAVIAGFKVAVMTTDTDRAGGIEQLATFTNVLKLDLLTMDRSEELGRAVFQAGKTGSVLIDSFGVNPYRNDQLARLGEFITAADAEPILVLAASGDPAEQADIARRFADLGVHRLLLTRLDSTRRFGAALGAADAAGLWFSEVGISPYVGQGLHGLDSNSLARMVLRDPDLGDLSVEFDKAV